MQSETQRNLVRNNEEYAAKYTQSGLPLPPAKKTAIVTCMDARLDPAASYGLGLGDAIIIRNAGASAKDAFRSLLLSEHLLGVKEVLVIKHTRCGLLGATNAMARELVEKNLGPEAAAQELKDYDFLPIQDLEESAREDVRYLKAQKLLLGDVEVTGWLFDIDTGKVRKVVS